MALHYLDTSALAKRYLPEIGSGWVKELCSAEHVAISLLTEVELASLLARQTREGNLDAGQRDTILHQFLDDMQKYAVLGMTYQLAQRAVELLLQSPAPLRSLDALQLATAEECFRRATLVHIAAGGVVASDERLLQAARWAGLETQNPEDYA